MALRLALVIEGESEGAKKALEDTASGVRKLGDAAADASGKTGELAGKSRETAGGLGEVAGKSQAAAGGIAATGNAAGAASGKIGGLGTALVGLGAGLGITLAAGAVAEGFRVLAGLAAEFVNNLVSNAPRIKADLEAHESLIGRIAQKYRDVAGAVHDYGEETTRVLAFRAERNVPRLERDLAAELSGLQTGARELSPLFRQSIDESLRAPVDDLLQTVREGRPDVIAFRDAVASIGEASDDERVRNAAEDMLAATDRAAELQAELGRARDALSGLEGDADAAQRALGGLPRIFGDVGAAAEAEADRVARFNAELQRLGGLTAGSGAAPGVALPPPTPFAAGGIVTRPTLFRHAGGLGLAGEAGPEAILPLSRGADGKLGVRAFATGGIVSGVSGGGLFGAIRGELQNLERTIAGVIDAIGQGFLAGASRGEIFLDVLRQIAPAIGNIAGNWIAQIFGGGGLSPGAASLSGAGLFAAGGVVARPTLFAYGGGNLGLMGEAGPEAILPLSRTGSGFAVGARSADGGEVALPLTRLSSGKLGVSAFADGGVFDSGFSRFGGRAPGGGVVNNIFVETPNPRAFADDRRSTVRGAQRLLGQVGRFS